MQRQLVVDYGVLAVEVDQDYRQNHQEAVEEPLSNHRRRLWLHHRVLCRRLFLLCHLCLHLLLRLLLRRHQRHRHLPILRYLQYTCVHSVTKKIGIPSINAVKLQTYRHNFVELPPGPDEHVFVLFYTLRKHIMFRLRPLTYLNHVSLGLPPREWFSSSNQGRLCDVKTDLSPKLGFT